MSNGYNLLETLIEHKNVGTIYVEEMQMMLGMREMNLKFCVFNFLWLAVYHSLYRIFPSSVCLSMTFANIKTLTFRY